MKERGPTPSAQLDSNVFPKSIGYLEKLACTPDDSLVKGAVPYHSIEFATPENLYEMCRK